MPSVTAETVAAAAAKLHRAGTNPTVRAVTSELGAGSATTVHKYLKQWREEQERRGERAPLPAVLVKAAEDIWQQAMDQAQALFEQDRVVWDGTQKALEAERNDLVGTANKLRSELAGSRQAHQQDTEARQKAQNEVQVLRVERDRLQAQLEGQAGVIEELKEARAAAEGQQTALLQRIEEQFAHDVQQLRQTSDESEKRLMVQVDEERQRTKAVEKELARLRSAAIADRQSWDGAKTTLQSEHQAEVREVLEQVASARTSQGKSEAEALLLLERVASLESERLTLIDNAATAAATIAQLKERLGQAE